VPVYRSSIKSNAEGRRKWRREPLMFSPFPHLPYAYAVGIDKRILPLLSMGEAMLLFAAFQAL